MTDPVTDPFRAQAPLHGDLTAPVIEYEDPLPTAEEIAAITTRLAGDRMLMKLNARIDEVDTRIRQARLYEKDDPDWLKRARAYGYVCQSKRADVRRVLADLPVIPKTKGVAEPRPDLSTFPSSSFEVLGSAMARQKRLMVLSQHLYEAYGTARQLGTEEAWDASNAAWEAVHAMVTQGGES